MSSQNMAPAYQYLSFADFLKDKTTYFSANMVTPASIDHTAHSASLFAKTLRLKGNYNSGNMVVFGMKSPTGRYNKSSSPSSQYRAEFASFPRLEDLSALADVMFTGTMLPEKQTAFGAYG